MARAHPLGDAPEKPHVSCSRIPEKGKEQPLVLLDSIHFSGQSYDVGSTIMLLLVGWINEWSDTPDITQFRSSFLGFRLNAGVLIHPNYKQAMIYFASSLQIFSLRTSHFGGFQ